MNSFSLSEWVAANYDLANPIAVTLRRSYTNDVYLVEAHKERFILKVYGQDWRTEGEIRYEVALLHHLSSQGLLIPSAIPGRNRDLITHTTQNQRERYAVLFTYAPGRPPLPPFTPNLYEAFGHAIARMHHLSNDFSTPHPRRPLDLTYLMEETLALTLPLLQQSGERDFLQDLCGMVTDRITTLTAMGMDWGPIHGDATLDNLHVTATGEVVLYDFDSGGPGWRAADLQGWATNNPEYALRWMAFRRGYSEIRPILDADLTAAPYLTIAWDIWGIRIDLERRILQQGLAQTESYLREQIALLQARESGLKKGTLHYHGN